jgi:muramidase (phage lysozyme)
MADFSEEQIYKRKNQRDELKRLFVRAVELNKDKEAQEIRNMLDDQLELSYEELPHDDTYVRDLRNLHAIRSNSTWKGTDKELVDKSFEEFNSLELNLGMTALDQMSGGLYDDASKSELELIGRVYDRFTKTDSFGLGSRPFTSQLWTFTANTVKDPTTWLSGGVGAIATKTLGKVAARELIKKGIKESLEKKIQVGVGLSTTGSLLGVSSSGSIQSAQKEAGLRDEISVPELALSGTFGAVLPTAMQSAGKYIVGPTVRGLRRPIKGWQANISKESGNFAALQHLIDQTKNLLVKSNASVDDSAKSARGVLDNAWNKTDTQIKNTLNSLEYNLIPNNKIKDVLDKITNSRMGDIPKNVLAKFNIMKETENLTPAMQKQFLSEMRTGLYGISQKQYKDGESLYGAELNKAYKELRKLQNKYVTEKHKENAAFSAFNQMKLLEDDSLGKRLYGLATSKNATDKDLIAQEIIGDMVNTSGSALKLNKLRQILASIDKLNQSVGGGKTNTFKDMLPALRQGLGGYLRRSNDGGFSTIATILKTSDGFKFLKSLYPDDIKFFDNLQSISSKISKKMGSDTPSVITNMIAARTAAESGEKLAGKAGSILAPLITMTGIGHYRNLINNPRFQRVMVETINNNGRVPTFAHRILSSKPFNLKNDQIRIFQDQMLALNSTDFLLNTETTKQILEHAKEGVTD